MGRILSDPYYRKGEQFMRPTEKAKSNIEAKAPVKMEAGPLVRLPIKKTYCSKCQKLVKGQIQGSSSATLINCPKCSQRLWSRSSSMSWKGGSEAISGR
jgi:hypothetical protein